MAPSFAVVNRTRLTIRGMRGRRLHGHPPFPAPCQPYPSIPAIWNREKPRVLW
jgi:hypothetical protein